jgi:cytochrome c peroxidase
MDRSHVPVATTWLGAGSIANRARAALAGREGNINAPTVFNSGFNFRQFWDGRAEALEDQVDGPLQHPAEMGATWPQALAFLNADATYRKEFTELCSRMAFRPPM